MRKKSDVTKIRNRAICEQQIVLFLLGFRVNTYWKLHKWLALYFSLKKVMKELQATQDIGFLGAESWTGNPNVLIQYWRSYDELIAYARDKQATHFPEWVKFNEDIAAQGDIGLWHEIYIVEPGNIEGLYRNMSPIGLGAVMHCSAMEGSRIKHRS